MNVIVNSISKMYERGSEIRLIESERCTLTCVRRKRDESNLKRLISSSSLHGIVSDHEPVDVHQWRDTYLVIEGNHRVRTAQVLFNPSFLRVWVWFVMMWK